MLIEQTFLLSAAREDVAEFFGDIERVAACIPGVEDVEELDNGRYAAVLALRLGPIRAAFKGILALDDGEAPERFLATGEGRDRATGTVASVTFTAELAEAGPAQTEVSAVADLSLRGRLAQFGTGVVRAAAAEMVAEFAARANQALARSPEADERLVDAGADGRGQEAAGPTAPAPARGLLHVLLRGLLTSVLHGVRGWFGRRRRTVEDSSEEGVSR